MRNAGHPVKAGLLLRELTEPPDASVWSVFTLGNIVGLFSKRTKGKN